MHNFPEPIKLNVGSGRNILAGWVHVDMAALPGVDIVADLEKCRTEPLPLPNDSVEEFLLSHVLEHIHDALGLMQELWRVAKPGAKMLLRLPYGSSDDAWEDPTHVRPYFLNSLQYFAQPTYWRADYGYRGDWNAETIGLKVPKERYEGKSAQEILGEVALLRNVVIEMVVTLTAIKPLRPMEKELQTQPKISVMLK